MIDDEEHLAVLNGYVWDRYVWDMCGVRYVHNLLKNPATKHLAGKIEQRCWIKT